MGFDLNLPETAKALSSPVTKLIEVCAAGCGALYEPTQIRKKAQAEGDALVIMEHARAAQADIAIRAETRRHAIEERRQRNVEAITTQAVGLLPPVVSEAPVDPDWATRFFTECEDIGNAEMQSLWARLLAGEVARPRSFSMRTLGVVKNLSARDAEMFNLLCKHSFRSLRHDQTFPFVQVPDDEFWDGLGMDFGALSGLIEAGLITYHSLGIGFTKSTERTFVGNRRSFVVRLDAPGDVSIGNASFTVAGQELSGICEWDISDDRFEMLLRSFKLPCKVTEVTVQRVDGGFSVTEVVKKNR